MSFSVNDGVVIALGSNLAGEFDSLEALLESALERLAAAGFAVLRKSSWWRSASWPDQPAPDYLNGVVVVETGLPPMAALGRLREIEAAFGRRRSRRNDPRTLDLDLIAHGRQVIDQPELILPHPRAAERLFVMGPLAEIAPDWAHPILGETAVRLAAKATVGLDARAIRNSLQPQGILRNDGEANNDAACWTN